ncbi:MAG: choice-of-anchor D domain-containing protein [Deltaproteobacteria bacterium]|nr:choice-of-anchor D domain-containing protein [Deltaproteobacteria bacterium]
MRRGPWILECICLLAISASYSACSDATSSPDSSVILCTLDTDCPGTMICDNGVCREPIFCGPDGSCPDGMVCIDGLCVAGNPDGGVDGGDGGDGGDIGPMPDIEILEPVLSEGIYQINFGNVALGIPLEKQVQIRNAGDATLQILDLSFELGTDVEDFSVPAEITDALPLVIEPGGQTTIDIRYAASDGLTDHGILDIISNDPDEALVKIHLLSEFKGEAMIHVQPISLRFGEVPVGTSSQPLSFTVSNQGTGNALLTVEDIRFGLLGNADFGLTVIDADNQVVSPPTLLNNGDFLDVEVVYHPQQREEDADQVLVISDDSTHPSVGVDITGRGVLGDLAIQPNPVDMGRVRLGEMRDVVVSISNTGGASLSVSGVELENASQEWQLSSSVDLEDLPNNPYTLAAGESLEVTLAYTPTDVGSDEGDLVVTNSTEEPRRSASLHAEGYIPASVQTEPDPPEAQFGYVQLDFATGRRETASREITIRNVGGEPLVVSSIQLADATSSEYTFNPDSMAAIQSGDSELLELLLTPTSQGPKNGALWVDTNDPDIAYQGVQGRFLVVMQAEAIDPNIFVTPPAAIDFGEVYAGREVVETVDIRNSGSGPLEVQTIEMTTGSSNDYWLDDLPTLPATILGAASVLSFEVHYRPATLGEDSGALLISNSDIGAPQVLIALDGMGVGCPPNYIDCDGITQNGCERYCLPSGVEICNYIDDDCDCQIDEGYDLDTDPDNCGSCNNSCDIYPYAQGACDQGDCFLLTCIEGYSDCNSWEGDGCEKHTAADVDNCGGCGHRCSFDNADAECYAGRCIMGECDHGFANCDDRDDTGCEVDTDKDEANCGGCGHACTYANGIGICLGGICFLNACLPGFEDCDRDWNQHPSNGCEVNLLEDPENCDHCGNECPSSGGTPVCNNGVCGVSDCAPGLADCDGDGVDCETDIANDPYNCGSCFHVCDLPNSTADCVNQTCVVDFCDPDWGDCTSAEGCETDLTSTVNHCGFCGRACSFPHAEALCVDSDCVMGACEDHYFDITADPGCECAEGDYVSDVCAEPAIPDLGSFMDGEQRTLSGNLVPEFDEDWYTFTAMDNHTQDVSSGSDSYHLRILFVTPSGPTNPYAMDVYRSTNTSANCANKPAQKMCSTLVYGEYNHYAFSGDPPWACGSTTGWHDPPLCTNDSARYWIRIYRRDGYGLSCDGYEVRIEFTQ